MSDEHAEREPQLGGWVCMDDDAFEVLGWGDSLAAARDDAHEVIRDLLIFYLTEEGIEVHLKYYQATKAAMSHIMASGGENLDGKFVKWKGKDILALKEENIEQRCTKTPDMFDGC